MKRVRNYPTIKANFRTSPSTSTKIFVGSVLDNYSKKVMESGRLVTFLGFTEKFGCVIGWVDSGDQDAWEFIGN